MQDAAPLSTVFPAMPANLLARYNSYFHTQAADTPCLVRTAQAIRYQVYCLERGFESACAHGDCLERDAFDQAAAHSLIFHRPTSDAIGTARLILPRSDAILPFEQLLVTNGFRAGDYVPLQTAAEVSRFAISNQFRRRRGDGVIETDDARHTREPECRGSLPCLGLIQELVRQSFARGLTHWVAVMEPKLLRMLAAMGIHFAPSGPLVSHHGLRQPSYCHLAEMLERLKRERPDHWMVVTDAGKLMPSLPLAEAQRRAA
jgi:N-acyl amino acid synthase of PEP-CTERM/exosortase system